MIISYCEVPCDSHPCVYIYIYIVTSVPSTHQHCPGDGHESPTPAHHGWIGHTWRSFARGQISRVRPGCWGVESPRRWELMCYLSFISRNKRVTDPALPQKLSTDPPRTGIPLGEHQSTSASTPALPHSLPVNKPNLRGIYLSSPCRVILPPRHTGGECGQISGRFHRQAISFHSPIILLFFSPSFPR